MPPFSDSILSLVRQRKWYDCFTFCRVLLEKQKHPNFRSHRRSSSPSCPALCPGIRDRWRVMVWTTIDSMAVRRRVSWGIETSVTLASEIGLSKTKDHLFCWISHWILTRYLKPGQNQEPMTKQNQLQKNMRFDSIKSFQLKQKTWWL